ncbi:MAG: hypothetical protein DMF79_06430 [Acidobacteria bacterium]|nr:MAG: hypothetical protein DMF79_06430 [Acidobacteriota bacterium]
MSGWLDARGCLTEAGFAAVSAAAVGQVPPELAGHLASCGRCQQRLLGGGAERPAVKRKEPSLGRMLFVVAAAVLAILGLLLTLRYLATPP